MWANLIFASSACFFASPGLTKHCGTNTLTSCTLTRLPPCHVHVAPTSPVAVATSELSGWSGAGRVGWRARSCGNFFFGQFSCTNFPHTRFDQPIRSTWNHEDQWLTETVVARSPAAQQVDRTEGQCTSNKISQHQFERNQ